MPVLDRLILSSWIAWGLLFAGPTLWAAAPKEPAATPATPPLNRSLLERVDLFEVASVHSPIEFSVAWMGISRVRGTFERTSGTLLIDRNDMTRSSFAVAIDISSLTTWNEDRDQDLKSDAWFDVERYPLGLFASHSMAKREDGYVLRGTLTLRGVNKEIEVPLVFNGRIQDEWGFERVGFEGSARLNRKEFGIVGPPRWNLLTELGKAMVGENVDIAVAVEGVRTIVRKGMIDRTSDSLWRAVEERGVEAVANQYRAARARTPSAPMAVTDTVLNAVGHQLLQNGKAGEALAVFTLEAEHYPQSALAASGLARAHATLGRREEAITAAEKAITLDPGATLAHVILNHLRGAAGD